MDGVGALHAERRAAARHRQLHDRRAPPAPLAVGVPPGPSRGRHGAAGRQLDRRRARGPRRRAPTSASSRARSASPTCTRSTSPTTSSIVVVAPDHPWARRRRPLTVRDAGGDPARRARDRLRHPRDARPRARPPRPGAPSPPALELGSTVAVKSAVMAGVGPAVISRLAVEGELATGRLVAVDLEGVAIERTLRAVWSRAHGAVGRRARRCCASSACRRPGRGRRASRSGDAPVR